MPVTYFIVYINYWYILNFHFRNFLRQSLAVLNFFVFVSLSGVCLSVCHVRGFWDDDEMFM